MKLRWFLSGTVREATELCNRAGKMLNAQRDLLSAEAVSALEAARRHTQKAIDDHADKETLRKSMGELETTANKWLRPYPHSEWRENIEVFLVAIAVAMAIRTFFLQPFKIPTGSMQPTLYGIEYEPAEVIPGRLGKIVDACVRGTFYHHLVAEADGELVKVDPPTQVFRFINKQTIWMKYEGRNELTPHSIWFSPGDEEQKYQARSGMQPGKFYRKGQDIIRIKEIAGDHLFVDRVTYNFRAPKRGEIMVFKTKGIEKLRQDQFYIKRMVAMGGETVSIGDDQHLRINGVRLDASTPHFGNVYTFDPVPRENHYFGHVNDTVARRYLPYNIAEYFPNEQTTVQVRPNHYMVMGDNTLNSYDSRGWGDFPRENVIGKSFFVYWPISNHAFSRFGWGHTAE